MRDHLSTVFNERDKARRREAMASVYAADITFSDPDGIVTGHEDLNATIQRLLDQTPAFVFSRTGPIRTNHDLGYLTWGLGPEGQPPVVQGIDIAIIHNGLIRSLYTLLTNS
ncbi:nuclear transport factor 2 family protein [Kibdelosporangium lantanae]